VQIDEVLATAMDLDEADQLKAEQEREYISFEETYFSIAGKIETVAIVRARGGKCKSGASSTSAVH